MYVNRVCMMKRKGPIFLVIPAPCREIGFLPKKSLSAPARMEYHAPSVKIGSDWLFSIGLGGFWQMEGKCTAGMENTLYGNISSMHLHDLLCHG